jgi:hypothetical protein
LFRDDIEVEKKEECKSKLCIEREKKREETNKRRYGEEEIIQEKRTANEVREV